MYCTYDKYKTAICHHFQCEQRNHEYLFVNRFVYYPWYWHMSATLSARISFSLIMNSVWWASSRVMHLRNPRTHPCRLWSTSPKSWMCFGETLQMKCLQKIWQSIIAICDWCHATSEYPMLNHFIYYACQKHEKSLITFWRSTPSSWISSCEQFHVPSMSHMY